MQYLANWRMQLAANYLLSGSDSVAAIAERVGYRIRSGIRPGLQEDGRCRAEPVAQAALLMVTVLGMATGAETQTLQDPD